MSRRKEEPGSRKRRKQPTNVVDLYRYRLIIVGRNALRGAEAVRWATLNVGFVERLIEEEATHAG